MPEDAALLTTLILERPLCAECIASKGGFTALDIEQGFNSVRGVLKLVETTGPMSRVRRASGGVLAGASRAGVTVPTVVLIPVV